MSGIAGIFDFHSSVDSNRIKRMTDAIAHRGPQEYFWNTEDQKLFLGLRSAESSDIVFDGAIHNSIELRENLKAKGHIFKTDGDAELVFTAYKEYNENCLSYFDGMFAFALWDSVTQTLFCARDRFGMKPFFFYHDKNSFRFASEMKGLWADDIAKEVNEKMLFYYLAYHVNENPFDKSETFYKNIFRLEAAHYLLVKKDGSLTKKKYYEIDLSRRNDLSFERASEHLRELFFQSIHRRLRSTDTIGSSLSGGVDSSSVVTAAVRWHITQPLPTFSARFNNSDLDEGKFMDEVAAHVSIQRNDVWIDEQVLLNDFDKMFFHQEEPLLDASPLAQWCVMKAAKEKGVSVLLDGQGADSVLGGATVFYYSFYRELLLNDTKKFREELEAYKKLYGDDFPLGLNFILRSRFPSLFKMIGELRRRFTTPDYLSFLNPDFANTFKNEPPPFHIAKSFNEALNYSVTTYGLEKLLRYADRNSSAFSVEPRFPFLNHELVEFVLSLPASYKMRDGWTKYILRSSMQSLLPASIAWRVNKLGYQPPLASWIQNKKVKEKISGSAELLFAKNIFRSQTPPHGKEWALLNAAALF